MTRTTRSIRVIGYEIHDLVALTSYFVKDSTAVSCPIDRSSVEMAEMTGDVVTCGMTIVEIIKEQRN